MNKSLKEIMVTHITASDIDLIKIYFKENNLLEQGIELLNDLNKELAIQLKRKIYLQNEWQICVNVVLYNDLDSKIKCELYNLVYTLTFIRELDENEKKQLQKIFKYNKIIMCPNWILSYLGISNSEYDKERLENVRKIRDGNK